MRRAPQLSAARAATADETRGARAPGPAIGRVDREPHDAAQQRDGTDDGRVAPVRAARISRRSDVDAGLLDANAEAALRGLLHDLLQHLRQDAQRLAQVRELPSQLLGEVATAQTVCRPVVEDRLRGLPDVELGVQLPAQALDVEQRLLQQDQLRLERAVEAPRVSNSRSSTVAEGDVLQRLVEDRLADRAHGRLDLVDARVARHPAGFDVQHGDAPVVAIEEREEVLGQVVLVARDRACRRCRSPRPQ